MSFIDHLCTSNHLEPEEAQRWVAAVQHLDSEALRALDTWAKKAADIAADLATASKSNKEFSYHRGAHDALRTLRAQVTGWLDGIVASYQSYTATEQAKQGEEQSQ